jgi:hypothetical protein
MVAASSSLNTGKPDSVRVFRQNTLVAEYPLGDDIAFTVAGKKSPVEIEIKNGIATIIHSDCPKKICKQSGGIRKPHEQLICAPNNVLIEVHTATDNDEDVDAMSY